MKQNKVIGLTGGIASGKSTVSKYLKSNDYPVVDADEISREVVEVNKPAYKKIVKNFGKEILNSDLSINREKLGSIIFKDDKLRLKLNKIIHPNIIKTIKKRTNEYLEKYRVVFLDIPLLLETRKELEGKGINFDEIWLVYAYENQQLDRLMKRDNLDKESAIKRIKAQKPLNEKINEADVVIYNTDTKILLIEKIKKLLQEL
ncbi:MAG: dephospho-CoA kinase [Firmicutes bacterium]|nr:dephospho-CoA kinase [Bacillota bacterium]